MIAFVTRILLPHAARARRQAGWAAQCKGRLLTPAIWANGCKSQVNAARFNADFCRKFRAEASDTLEQVQRKNKQLRVQLSKSPWPKLKFFSSKGQNYGLPLRAESRDLRCLPVGPVLAYLAGFFDGDGCVACQQNMSGCSLVIGQSFDQAEVLVLFYETFGGSITLHRGGLGLNKPVLAWRACGQSARAAAQFLMPYSITKQKQLLLAAEWPVARSRREECKAELRALKKYDSAVSGRCSWEYCAGFFDAEGCISQQRGGASLVLWLSAKARTSPEVPSGAFCPKLRQRCDAGEVGRICTRAFGLRADLLQADTATTVGRWTDMQSRTSKASCRFDEGDCGPSER